MAPDQLDYFNYKSTIESKMQQNRLDRESPQKDKNTVLHKCNLCILTFAANHGRTVAAPSLGIGGGGGI